MANSYFKQNVFQRLSYYLLLVFCLCVLPTCKKDNGPFPTAGAPNDFLSSKNYSSLIVEIQYIQGNQPDAQTINNLRTFLQARLNKPGGISFVMESISSPNKNVYSLEDIAAVEHNSRVLHPHENIMTAYFLFVDGDYASNNSSGSVLGITYGPTSVVIFEKTIMNFSGGFGQPSRYVLESTVAEHEFGHMLGLVNNGTRMQSNHQDLANGHHCNNQNCLMYYNVETSNVVANLVGGNITPLDATCINDLRGNGGK